MNVCWIAIFAGFLGVMAGFVLGFLVAWLLCSNREPAPAVIAVPPDKLPSEPEIEIHAVVEPQLAAGPESAVEPDDLTRITGIGKVFAARLQRAGITSFAELAACTPEQVLARIEVNIDPKRIGDDDWVGQAAALAAAKRR